MIVFTRHVLERIVERGLDRSWIETTIMEPDWIRLDEATGVMRSFKSIASVDRVLRVVHRARGSDILVVTAHFDRGAMRDAD